MNKLLTPDEAASLILEQINESTKDLSEKDKRAVIEGLSSWFFGETKVG